MKNVPKVTKSKSAWKNGKAPVQGVAKAPTQDTKAVAAAFNRTVKDNTKANGPMSDVPGPNKAPHTVCGFASWARKR
jgi:hypothetical protein